MEAALALLDARLIALTVMFTLHGVTVARWSSLAMHARGFEAPASTRDTGRAWRCAAQRRESSSLQTEECRGRCGLACAIRV